MHCAVAGIICMCGGMLWYDYVVYVCMRYMRGALWRVCVVWHIVYGVECDMVYINVCVYVCLHACVCTYHKAYMEVTEYLVRVRSLLAACDSCKSSSGNGS